MANKENKYAAPEQNLGYLYQSHFALYHLLSLPESTLVAIEKEDDIVFSDEAKLSLGSMKHKKEGDRLTNLDMDFWKSVRIWLEAYESDGRRSSTSVYFLFTTATITPKSFLNMFASRNKFNTIDLEAVEAAASKSDSQALKDIKKKFDNLCNDEKLDFLSRIQICDESPRIEDIESLVTEKYFRSIELEFRDSVYERLIGWWDILVINQLAGLSNTRISGIDVSDKLSRLSREFGEKSLPIDYLEAIPSEADYVSYERKMFVKQLEAIDVSRNSINSAILDYYRAFTQRCRWVREDLLIDNELEKYEKKLIDEWSRYREAFIRQLDEDTTSEKQLKDIGFKIYKWAELEARFLQIRNKVTEDYVRRGHFHILADENPPRIYWHPLFLENIKSIFQGGVDGTME